MDTPTHTLFLLTFLMAGFILFALTPGRGCSSQLRAAAVGPLLPGSASRRRREPEGRAEKSEMTAFRLKRQF